MTNFVIRHHFHRCVQVMLLFVFLYIFVFFLIILACSMFGYAILQPIAKAVKGKRRPTRFTTNDFLWLTILLQIPLALLSNAGRWFNNDSYTTTIIAVTAGFVVFLVVGVWWRGVATLSGLGINSVWRRGVFLTILLPVAIYGSAVGMPMLLLAPFSIGRSNWLYAWLGLVVLTPLVAYCFRVASHWVLAEIEQPPILEETIHPTPQL